MKILYFDCAMGAAGDMLMAALLELHAAPEEFLNRLNTALCGKAIVSAERDEKCGIQGRHVSVRIGGHEEGEHHHNQRHGLGIADIYRHIDGLELSETVKQNTRAVYKILAEAESAVHGAPVENIHFHELGTLDALADILGVCMLMEELAVDAVYASPVHVGSGMVKCAHGLLPVPAPATERILRGMPIYSSGIKGELCTPTGAALLKHFVLSFGDMPVMRLEKSGYGTGKKDFEAANLVRALLGEAEGRSERLLELCCNLDDMTPEALAFAAEELFSLGALDVYTESIGMKKGRAGTMLCCMCRTEQRDTMLESIFKHTTTLGVREYICGRYSLSRSACTRHTELGDVSMKRAEGFGVSREKPEYEDLAAIARREGLSLREVIEKL